MMSEDPVKQRAARIAISLASVPLFVKNDFQPLPGAIVEILRAKAACGSVGNTVETCWSRSTCSCTALFTFSLQ